MVTSVPTATTFTITMEAQETGTPLTTSDGNSTSILCYYNVGPSQQLGGFGWGTALWGGTANGPATSTLSTTLPDDATTTVVLANTSAFPASGEIRIGSEDISFTNNDTGTGTLSGGARAVNGTTRAAHTGGATVTNISAFVAWGEASSSDFTIDPGLWILDNYGTKLIALIYNGACFEWDASPSNATSIRATIIPNAPTASRHVLVSTPDRHLVFFGTETTVGNSATQDDMFIRFSSQESIDQTDSYTVRANNTAGTQRLADGSRIMGAIKGRDAIYVWTDTALFLMKFVGQPFTFAFEQVGNNCGLIGMNAAVEVDGAAYWMSENGFFRYTGKLESMDCLVEDYVYDDLNTTSNQLVYCGINNLFGEITWFYPTSTSNVVNRAVTYSYLDSTAKRPIWFTNASSLFPRTTWEDSSVFGLPHGTQYNASVDTSFDVTGNTDGTTIYFEHETGVNQQLAASAAVAIPANITSGDYDITQKVVRGAATNLGDLRGDGENIMRVSRIIPDFISQQGNAIIQLDLRNYPNNTAASSSLGPFTVSSSTDKVDTRARARAVALTISNTAVDTSWKLGTFRLDIHAGGRR